MPVLVAFALVLVILAALPSSAQPSERTQLGRFHFGPVYVTPTINIRNFGLDTNVFRTADDPKSDFTATVGPQIDALIRLRRFRLTATSITDYVYFAQYPTERSLDTNFDVGGEVELRRRLTLFASNGFINSKQRLNYEIDARARRVENNLRAGIRLGLARKLNVALSLRRYLIRFDADAIFEGTNLSQVLNRNTNAGTASIEYAVTPLTTLVLSGTRSKNIFDLSPERSTNSFRIMPGVELNPRALVTGGAHVGYERFKALNPALPDFSGVVASVDLAYTFRNSTRFGVTGSRDVEYSYQIQEPYYVRNGFGGSIRRQLGSRFDVSLGAGLFRFNYRLLQTAGGREPDLGPNEEPPQAPTLQPGRRDMVHNYTWGFGYRINRVTRAGLDVSYYRRTSNRPDRWPSRDGLRVGTTFTYGF